MYFLKFSALSGNNDWMKTGLFYCAAVLGGPVLRRLSALFLRNFRAFSRLRSAFSRFWLFLAIKSHVFNPSKGLHCIETSRKNESLGSTPYNKLVSILWVGKVLEFVRR